MNNSNSSETLEVDPIKFFFLNLSEYFPYTFLACFSTIIGIFGNIVIVGAILCTKELKTVSNMFVFNISIADFFISLLVDSFTAVGVLAGKNFFDKRPGLCEFVAFACLVFCETSLITIGFLAFNRYIKICYSNLYHKMFTTKLTIFYCGICWLIGFLITLPNVTGWSNLVYDKDTLNCMWNRLASRSYSMYTYFIYFNYNNNLLIFVFIKILSIIINCISLHYNTLLLCKHIYLCC